MADSKGWTFLILIPHLKHII
uniref:Uncharacterized protein n=1 Tax=Anguilla anguilla TaxID=7936 RepID=A0A0E9QNF4_ANGAN